MNCYFDIPVHSLALDYRQSLSFSLSRTRLITSLIPARERCPSSTQLGQFLVVVGCLYGTLMNHRNYRRSMQRAPRAPKRSPTPTSATFPPGQDPNSSVPNSPVVATPGAGSNKPLYLCSPFVEAALVKGNFKTIVMLPKYVDIMEWVAVNSAYIALVPA